MKPLIDAEVWRVVENFPNYSISSFGRIKSVARKTIYTDGRVYEYKEKILTPALNNSGYLYVSLRHEGKAKKYFIHGLVVRNFLLKKEGKPFIDHIDGDKTNNNLSNLEWINKIDNQLHSTRILRKNIGEKHSNAILTNANVGEIRKLFNKALIKDIAALYGVSISCISSIKTGRTWSV